MFTDGPPLGSASGEFQVSKGVSNGKMKISRLDGELQVSKGVSNGKMKISRSDPRRAQGSSSGEFQVSKGVSNGKMKISRSEPGNPTILLRSIMEIPGV